LAANAFGHNDGLDEQNPVSLANTSPKMSIRIENRLKSEKQNLNARGSDPGGFVFGSKSNMEQIINAID
jgi:hypothetical protein